MKVRLTKDLLAQEEQIMNELLRQFREEYQREPHFAERLGMSSECRRIRRERGPEKESHAKI